MPYQKLLALSFLSLLSQAAMGFDYKEIKDFKTISQLGSSKAFEKQIDDYVQDCLDHGYGGTRGIPCFVAYKLWDRELNHYYKLLYRQLPQKKKQLLQDSQKAWLLERDKTMVFNEELAGRLFKKDNNEYRDHGTMHLLIHAGHIDQLNTPLVKQRTLLFLNMLSVEEDISETIKDME